MDLLVSSASTCYLLTTVGMLNIQNFNDIELNLNTETDPESKKLIINHFIEIKVPSDFDDNKINIIKNIITKADKTCHVGSILRKADIEIYAKGLVVQK